MKSRLGLCLCGLLLTGCISIGNPLLAEESVVAQIKVGQTTKGQVVSLLGEPAQMRSSVSMGHTHEWWRYSYSSSLVNPLKYVLLYGLFVNGIGTPDTQRVLDVFYSPEGTVETLSLMTTSYDLSGPYWPSKVTSTTRIDMLPSGFGNPIRFEDKVGDRDQ